MNELTVASNHSSFSYKVGEVIGVVLGLCLLAAIAAAVYGLFTSPAVTLFLLVSAFFGGLLLIAGISIMLIPVLYLLNRLFIGTVS
ncbi:hypothetical protein GP5015_1581 [gamma proteobacterium HTCC5015]|nr:hypothetical protein GP5015_1581 [gamma proteobacterium HTCC5015]